MAATNYTPIQLYYSTTASAAPTAGNLTSGELAINITDGKLYYKDNGGVVQVIATKGAGTIGGSTTQIQYNNAGALAGSAAMTFNSGTNTVTLTTLNLTNALGATYGGTAQSAYAQGDVLYASAANTLSKLGIGTVNYILTSTGSVPQWSAPSSITVQTATNLAGGAGGSVPYQSAADTTTFLAIGAANRVMTSSGSAPQWVTALTGLTGVSSSSITNTSLTSGRLVYSSTAGLEVDSANLTFDGTTLSATGYSTTGLSTLVKTVKIGDSNFSGVAVFAPATPAKLYIGTGTVTDTTSAIGATNATGAIASLAITPIAATNTSVTYTNASTLYIAGAPSAGANVTITNPYALYIAAGANYFGGAATFNSATTFATDITVYGITVGRGAGAVSTNTSVGASALAANTTAVENTAVGYFALKATTGQTNTAVGAYAAYQNTTGYANTAIGDSTLQTNTTGITNTAVGQLAMSANTTGSTNTSVGASALQSNTTASNNTAVGYQALYSNTTATLNTAVGVQSGYSNTTGRITAVGAFALNSNTTGQSNVAVGGNDGSVEAALQANTTGAYNTATGIGALSRNTTASNNTAVGYRAGYTSTTAEYNTLIGGSAGQSITTGSRNTIVGYGAGSGLTTGQYNTFIGMGSDSSGQAITTGSKNTILGPYNGNQGGLDIRTASNFIVLSDGDGNPRGIFDSSGTFMVGKTDGNYLANKAGCYLAANGTGVWASSGTSAINLLNFVNGIGGTPAQVGAIQTNGSSTSYVTSSDYRLKNSIEPMTGALAKVAALKPVTYKWNLDGSDGEGFIAHELAEVCPHAVTGEKDAVDEDGKPKYQGIDTSFLVATLTAAIQEQQALIESLTTRLAALEAK